ncbi:MAG: hypothetical protein M3N16_09025 [Actinomycetota bacterium]|nr:hypothetical protein [Actinomycetota bacterium]
MVSKAALDPLKDSEQQISQFHDLRSFDRVVESNSPMIRGVLEGTNRTCE